MRAALEMAQRSGEPGSGIAVAAPAHLLLAEPRAAAEWWPAVRAGTVRMVSLGGADRAPGTASSWRACGGRGWRPATSRWRSWRRCCAGSRRACWVCRRRAACTRGAMPTWQCWTRRRRWAATMTGRFARTTPNPPGRRTTRRSRVRRTPDSGPARPTRGAARLPGGAARWCGCCAAVRLPRPAPVVGSAPRRCANLCNRRGFAAPRTAADGAVRSHGGRQRRTVFGSLREAFAGLAERRGLGQGWRARRPGAGAASGRWRRKSGAAGWRCGHARPHAGGDSGVTRSGLRRPNDSGEPDRPRTGSRYGRPCGVGALFALGHAALEGGKLFVGALLGAEAVEV